MRGQSQGVVAQNVGGVQGIYHYCTTVTIQVAGGVRMGEYSMEIVQLLREQLRVREQNLAKLELQAARHGMYVPLPLQNQIDFESQKMEELRSRLSEAEAGLDVGEDALGLVAEKPVPLWRKVPMWA
jgi:hypothetical protein